MTDLTLHAAAFDASPRTLADAVFDRDDAFFPPPIERGIVRIDALTLASGAVLPRAEIAWQSVGAPDAPVVLVLGGISAGRHFGGDGRGWWDMQCGVGRALDPREVRIVGIDWLGGCDDSTGPRGDTRFPDIDTADQAAAIEAVLAHLCIARLALVVGASYGGCVALKLVERLDGRALRVDRLVVIGAAHRASPWARALRTLQRADVADARDAETTRAALVRARTLAMLSYRTPSELDARFSDGDDVFDWLHHHGERFADRFDAVAFLRLSASLDAHRCEPEKIRTPTTLVAIREDLIVPVALVRALAKRLGGPSDVIEIDSIFGHDAFLKEVDAIGSTLRDAVASITPTRGVLAEATP